MPPHEQQGSVEVIFPGDNQYRTIYYAVGDASHAVVVKHTFLSMKTLTANIFDVPRDYTYLIIRQGIHGQTLLDCLFLAIEHAEEVMDAMTASLRQLPGFAETSDAMARDLLGPLTSMTGEDLVKLMEEEPGILSDLEVPDQLAGQDASPQRQSIRTLATAIVANTALSSLLGFLSLPFILTKQTMGGAEGTEIVTYTEETGENTATVYYAYLHTALAQPPPVRIAHRTAGGQLVMWDDELAMGEYAMLVMTRAGASSPWYPTSTAKYTIGSLGSTDSLLAAIDNGYAHACSAMLGDGGPHTPVRWGSHQWTCPHGDTAKNR